MLTLKQYRDRTLSSPAGSLMILFSSHPTSFQPPQPVLNPLATTNPSHLYNFYPSKNVLSVESYSV